MEENCYWKAHNRLNGEGIPHIYAAQRFIILLKWALLHWRLSLCLLLNSVHIFCLSDAV